MTTTDERTMMDAEDVASGLEALKRFKSRWILAWRFVQDELCLDTPEMKDVLAVYDRIRDLEEA
jgi:Holliday junction resolvase